MLWPAPDRGQLPTRHANGAGKGLWASGRAHRGACILPASKTCKMHALRGSAPPRHKELPHPRRSAIAGPSVRTWLLVASRVRYLSGVAQAGLQEAEIRLVHVAIAILINAGTRGVGLGNAG